MILAHNISFMHGNGLCIFMLSIGMDGFRPEKVVDVLIDIDFLLLLFHKLIM